MNIETLPVVLTKHNLRLTRPSEEDQMRTSGRLAVPHHEAVTPPLIIPPKKRNHTLQVYQRDWLDPVISQIQGEFYLGFSGKFSKSDYSES